MQNPVVILCLYHMYLWTFLSWKKEFIIQNLLLPQSCNKYRPFSLNAGSSCQPITPFFLNVSLSVPMCALKSFKRNANSVDLLSAEHCQHHPQKPDIRSQQWGHKPTICKMTGTLPQVLTYRTVIPKKSNLTHSLTTEASENSFTRSSRNTWISTSIEKLPPANQV